MGLRPATENDAASLAALSIEVWLGTYLKDGVNSFFASYALATFTTENLTRRIQDPSEQIIVSDNENGIDAFLALKENAKNPITEGIETEITTLYVQPRHHGKGIGTALLGAALKRATGPVWLTTNSENTPAIQFYQAKGFTIIGQTDFQIEDQSYPNAVLSTAQPPSSDEKYPGGDAPASGAEPPKPSRAVRSGPLRPDTSLL